MSKIGCKVENEILGQLIRDLTDEGYGFEVEDPTTNVMIINVTDSEKKNDDDDYYVGHVKFVWGNVADCISDYSTDLETVIKDANDLSETYRD